MGKRSLDESRAGTHRSPEPDNNGLLAIQDLLSPGEEEHGQSSGPSKKPRNFIATVVSASVTSLNSFYYAINFSGDR